MRHLVFGLLLVLSCSLGYSQEAIKGRPSPTAIVTMKYEDTYVKITYCQPHRKGRTIFGELVPYGEIWRTGANEATEITVTKDIYLDGQKLESGTYSLFTIPGPEEWTVILNSGLGQWGAYTYNEELDVIRVKGNVKSTNGVTWEPFTIAFEQNNDKADLALMWGQTKVTVPLEFIPEED